MFYIGYNHLYYFWHVCKEGSAVGAAEALYLTPQTITGRAKAFEERLQGKLFKRRGRGLKPNELGELVFRYAGKMFTLDQEMLDIVNYRKESSSPFDVGVADALSKQLVSSVLDVVVAEDGQIYLRCFESTHEMLLDQLSQHKLDMIIFDCPIDPTQQEGLLSVRIGGCGVSFWYTRPLPRKPLPTCLEKRRLLIPGYRSMLGCKLLNWINSQGLNVEILGGFDDVALMRAFGVARNTIFAAPTPYSHNFYADDSIVEIGHVENAMEEYHVIFAERMIQHPVVQRICNADYSVLFTPTNK